MSTDKEKSQQEFAKDELEEDRNIWRTDTTDLEDDSVMERNALEIARDADRLAWIALWISVFAVVISVVSAAIGLSWQ